MIDQADAHTSRTVLAGRKAIVTGGTTGIGRAIAVLLASAGVRVFICGRDPRYLADALQRIGEVGDGSGIALDVAEPEQLTRFFDAAKSWLGGLDIAVINAAVPANGLSDMTEQELRYAIASSFTAYLVSAHAAQAAMEANPGGAGDIVLIGSVSAHTLGPSSTVYAGIKAGIAGFAQALHRELGPKGIRVALVEPGETGSDMQYPDIPEVEQRKSIHEETMLRAEDIAVAVHYLLTQPRRAVIRQLTISPRKQD